MSHDGGECLSVTVSAGVSLVVLSGYQPLHRRAFGYIKWLVSYAAGALDRIELGEVAGMQSYFGHQTFCAPGGSLRKTTNCFSWAGQSGCGSRRRLSVCQRFRRL